MPPLAGIFDFGGDSDSSVNGAKRAIHRWLYLPTCRTLTHVADAVSFDNVDGGYQAGKISARIGQHQIAY